MAHSYDKIDQLRVAAMTKALTDSGATVTGTNPWDVDTNSHGVKLHASWDAGTGILTISLVDKDWYVPEGKVWDTIDPMIHHIQQTPDTGIPV